MPPRSRREELVEQTVVPVDATVVLTIEQVAERLGLKPRSVRRLIANGELEYVNVGAGSKNESKRVRLDQLARFLDDRSS